MLLYNTSEKLYFQLFDGRFQGVNIDWSGATSSAVAKAMAARVLECPRNAETHFELKT